MNKFLILILLLIAACGAPQKKSVNYLGVEIKANKDDRLLPNIENNKLSQGVGPQPTDAEQYSTNKQTINKKVLALNLGPGINRVLCHVALLKEMEVQGQGIHIITGSGLGAVVASLYAAGMTPDKIEWIFYKFSKKTKGLKPFSKKWVTTAETVLLGSLKDKKIQNTKLRLLIPAYNSQTKKVFYVTRGEINTWLIREHLKLNQKNRMNSFVPFQKEIFNKEKLTSLGADLVVGIDVLGGNITFETTDHYLTGVFGRITGIISKEKEGLDFFIDMDPGNMPLDSNSKLPGYLQKCMVTSRDMIKNLKLTLQAP